MAFLAMKLDKTITIAVIDYDQLIYAKSYSSSDIDQAVKSIGSFELDSLRLYIKPDIREDVTDSELVDEISTEEQTIRCYMNQTDLNIVRSFCTLLKIRKLELYNCFRYGASLVNTGVFIDTYHSPLFSLVHVRSGIIVNILTCSHQGLLSTLNNLDESSVTSPYDTTSLAVSNSSVLNISTIRTLFFLNCVLLTPPCQTFSIVIHADEPDVEPPQPPPNFDITVNESVTKPQPPLSESKADEASLDDLSKLFGDFSFESPPDIEATLGEEVPVAVPQVTKGGERTTVIMEEDEGEEDDDVIVDKKPIMTVDVVILLLVRTVVALYTAITIFAALELPSDIVAFQSKLAKYSQDISSMSEEADYLKTLTPTSYNFADQYTTVKQQLEAGLFGGIRFIQGSLEIVVMFDNSADLEVFKSRLAQFYTIDQTITQSHRPDVGGDLTEYVILARPK